MAFSYSSLLVNCSVIANELGKIKIFS